MPFDAQSGDCFHGLYSYLNSVDWNIEQIYLMRNNSQRAVKYAKIGNRQSLSNWGEGGAAPACVTQWFWVLGVRSGSVCAKSGSV